MLSSLCIPFWQLQITYPEQKQLYGEAMRREMDEGRGKGEAHEKNMSTSLGWSAVLGSMPLSGSLPVVTLELS